MAFGVCPWLIAFSEEFSRRWEENMYLFVAAGWGISGLYYCFSYVMIAFAFAGLQI